MCVTILKRSFRRGRFKTYNQESKDWCILKKELAITAGIRRRGLSLKSRKWDDKLPMIFWKKRSTTIARDNMVMP